MQCLLFGSISKFLRSTNKASTFHGRTRQKYGRVSRHDTRVAIVGGGGNVGSYLSSHLRSAGIHVTSFDMDPNIAGMPIIQLHSNLCSH